MSLSIFDVTTYGAIGDGSHDDTSAIMNAITVALAVNGEVRFPAGTFLVSGTLEVNSPNVIKIAGIDASMGGTIIQQGKGVDKPVFSVLSGCVIEGLRIRGTNESQLTHQDGIFIGRNASPVNNVYLRNLFLDNLYNCVHIQGTVFYSYFDNVRFYSAINALLWGEGTTDAGYAIQINDCQATPDHGRYGLYFENAGSVMIDNLMMSPGTLTGASLVFVSNAPKSGVHQISNSVFEGSGEGIGIWFKGAKEVPGSGLTSRRPINHVMISNSYIAGKPSVQFDYATHVIFSNCYFTGGRGLVANYQAEDIVVSGSNFALTDCPFVIEAHCDSFSLDVANPLYGSTYPFFYSSGATQPTAIKRLNIFGGDIGRSATPIIAPKGTPINVNVGGGHSYLVPKALRFTGTLDSAGCAVTQVDFSKHYEGILSAQGFYRGPSGEMLPLTLQHIDGTGFRFAGGNPRVHYRVVILYTDNSPDVSW